MNEWNKNDLSIDYTEIYRQNYEDALDEIRNLKLYIAELEKENDYLRESYHKTPNVFNKFFRY